MILYTSYKNKLLILNVGFTAPQETKKAVIEHAVKIIMPYSVKNSSSEQHRKKIKSCFEGTSKKIGLFA